MLDNDGSPPNDAPLRAGEVLVFVYGSLLSGQTHHALLGRARLVGEAHTLPEYELVDFGEFPALVPGGATRVFGEVYAVDGMTLATLDELEDHPAYYRRTPVTLEDGAEVQVYLMSAWQAAGFPRLAAGDWRRRAERV